MRHPDALALANELDVAWHEQPRTFEREAATRFWGLLTLPARVLDPARPRDLLRSATVLRNARFKGDPVKDMFFEDKDFTEVDALFLQVGSSLGHPTGEDAWVVEVERKTANHQSDYYRAAQRARKFAEWMAGQFGVRARPVVIYDDDGGTYNVPAFDGEVLHIQMGVLRQRTSGLRFPSLSDLPGVACDRTLVKLALLRQLAVGDTNRLDWGSGTPSLRRIIDAEGWPLRLPVVGHQDMDRLPNNLPTWLRDERESDVHLEKRIDAYLDELFQKGALNRRSAPRLSLDGGQIVLNLLRAECEDPS